MRVSRSVPRHSSPPLRGAGSEHSRLRQWVQSSPQADHLLHGLQLPSTRCETDMDREEMAWSAQGASPGHLPVWPHWESGPGAMSGLGPSLPGCKPSGVQRAWMMHANDKRHDDAGPACFYPHQGPSWPWGSEGTWSHNDPLIPGTGGSAAPGWGLPHTDSTCPDCTLDPVTQPLC